MSPTERNPALHQYLTTWYGNRQGGTPPSFSGRNVSIPPADQSATELDDKRGETEDNSDKNLTVFNGFSRKKLRSFRNDNIGAFSLGYIERPQLQDSPSPEKKPSLMMTKHDDEDILIELTNSATAEQLQQAGFDLSRNKDYLCTKTKNSIQYFYPGKSRNPIKFGKLISPGGNQLVAVKKNTLRVSRQNTDQNNLSPRDQESPRPINYRLTNEFIAQKMAGDVAPKLYGIAFGYRNNGPDVQQVKGYLAMELITGGTLCHKIYEDKINTKRSTTQLTSLALQIANALNKIHERNIVHFDFRTTNIMIDQKRDHQSSASETTRVVVIDYGHAKYLNKPIKSTDFETTKITFCFAPEVFTSSYLETHYGKAKSITSPAKVDIYSLGTVFCELFGKNTELNTWNETYASSLYYDRGIMAYLTDDSPDKILKRIEQKIESRINRKILQNNIPNKELKTMICSMLAVNPESRPELKTIIDSLEQFWVTPAPVPP